MKKFIGAICSGFAGVLTLVMMCFTWYTSNSPILFGGHGELKFTGWQILADEGGYLAKTYESGYTLFKVFAIIAIVVAALLILMSIVLVLKNLKILKVKFNFNIINNVLLTVLAVLAIVLPIILCVMANGYIDTFAKYNIVATAGTTAAVWIQLAVSVLLCGCGWALARKDK